MKTKELITRVDELGYLFENRSANWQITTKDGLIIAEVSKISSYKFSTDFDGWIDVPDEDKIKLLDLIVEYARTSIEDRLEEEKKFYLKHKWFMTEFGDKYYLCKCYNSVGDVSYANRISYSIRDEIWLFTLKEIEEIKETFDTDLSDFELVEVNNEN